MKNTLLGKVKTIEEAAQNIIVAAKREGEQKLEAVRSQEERSIDDIQQNAKKRGGRIVAERLKSVQDEIGKIGQESEQSVRMVHETGGRNQAEALKRAHQLLTDEYLA